LKETEKECRNRLRHKQRPAHVKCNTTKEKKKPRSGTDFLDALPSTKNHGRSCETKGDLGIKEKPIIKGQSGAGRP